jgi:hypothetical protein
MRDEIAQLNWICRCADAACVEVARDHDVVLMRDSKDSDGPMLAFTLEQWASFRAAAAAGEFDRG